MMPPPTTTGGCIKFIPIQSKMKLGIAKPEGLRDTPREVLNWKLFWSATVFGMVPLPQLIDTILEC